MRAADPVAEMTNPQLLDAFEKSLDDYRAAEDEHDEAIAILREDDIRAELLRRLGASGVDVEGLARSLFDWAVKIKPRACFTEADIATEIREHIAQPAGEPRKIPDATELAMSAYSEEGWEELTGVKKQWLIDGAFAAVRELKQLGFLAAPKEKDNG